MTNFMTKMQLRNLFLRSRQCSRHHKNDTHETPETLDTQRKNLQSIGLTVIRNYFKLITVSRWIQVC